ncbi:MAG: flagellar basal body rod protein FlgC [Deltaproteobacteria bacterium]|jgi:flagellar basal-body rod protein FlgC|nr:flagellar basal body rod protein FlgC [Deltaproteobacteria bacterium]
MSISVFQQLELAGRALSVQRTRLDVASTNLANAETTRTAEGTPFRRKDVILAEEQVADSFGNALDAAIASVKVDEIRDDPAPPKMVYEPGHPDANADGYVAYPNINTVEEMVNMITTMRTYQANLSAFGAVKEMAEQALGIGRNV